MAASTPTRSGKHRRQRRRRNDVLPVRHWLAAGAVSAGLTATLWGVSLAGPGTGVATADDTASSSSSSSSPRGTGATSSTSDQSKASAEADKPDRPAARTSAQRPGSDDDDDDREDAEVDVDVDDRDDAGDDDDQDAGDGGTDSRDTETEEADETAADTDEVEHSAAPTEQNSAAGDAGGTPLATIAATASEGATPEDSTESESEPRALLTASASAARAASPDTIEPDTAVAPVVTPTATADLPDTEVLTPAQSVVISLNEPSFGRQLVAGQISALMGTGRTVIGILPLAEPFKDWLYGALSGTRRTLFNQAPWLSPTQITADGQLPIVGTLNAVDLEGDEIRYKIVTGPAYGTVELQDDGTFTYTPDAGFTGVDNFVVSATDLGQHINLLDPFRSASTRASLLVNESAVSFVFNYTSGAGYWTPEARTALQLAAANLVGQFIVSTPVVLTYEITGENSLTTNTLASVDSPLIGSGAGFFPTVVQHKLLTGVDANGSAADGEINWNFAYPWAFGDFVSSQDYDFTMVAMHEFLHSLGFMSYVQQSTTATQRTWTLYDSFLRTSSGASLIGGDYRFDPALTANLTGGAGGVYFGGAAAVDSFGALVPLYAPGSWTQGSSISHLDSATFTGSNRKLMNPQVPKGTGVRMLSDVERAIMQDLGYTLAPLNVTSALTLVGFVFLRRRRLDN